MSWPPRHREGVRADILQGLKTIRAIAEDHKCSERFVYAVIVEEGLSRQYITHAEWRAVLESRRLAPDGVEGLVGSHNHATGKARRASDAPPLAETMPLRKSI